MKTIWVAKLALTFAAIFVTIDARAQADSGCSLNDLADCRNSNELFSRPTVAKPEFPDVLARFMRGAPKLYIGKRNSSAGTIANESLSGPGEKPFRFPSGEWFFDGFTPHVALDKGAVIVDASGRILAVALLNVFADTASPSPAHAASLSRYQLRIYSRDGDPRMEFIQKLQDWALAAVGNKSLYPGVFPKNTLTRTELFVLGKSGWKARMLP